MATVDEVRAVLRGVTDPELGINIIDLGLVYGIEVQGTRIGVTMTLTTPACPRGSTLVEDVERTLKRAFAGYEAAVSLVWEPRWTPERMADEVQRELEGS